MNFLLINKKKLAQLTKKNGGNKNQINITDEKGDAVNWSHRNKKKQSSGIITNSYMPTNS